MHDIFLDTTFTSPLISKGAPLTPDELLDLNPTTPPDGVWVRNSHWDMDKYLPWGEALRYALDIEDVVDYLPLEFIQEYYAMEGVLPTGEMDVFPQQPLNEIGERLFEDYGYDSIVPSELHTHIDYEGFGRDLLMDYDETPGYYYRAS